MANPTFLGCNISHISVGHIHCTYLTEPSKQFYHLNTRSLVPLHLVIYKEDTSTRKEKNDMGFKQKRYSAVWQNSMARSTHTHHPSPPQSESFLKYEMIRGRISLSTLYMQLSIRGLSLRSQLKVRKRW